MHTMHIAAGGFIFTKKVDEANYESRKKEFTKTFKLANDTGTVCTIAFPVPQNAENYNKFSELMNSQEKALIQDLTKSF